MTPKNTGGFIDSDEMPADSAPLTKAPVPVQLANPILIPIKAVTKKNNSGFLDSED